MFNVLTPDLVDPMLLAETNLPSLHDAIGLKGGEVTLTVDPTLRKPNRSRLVLIRSSRFRRSQPSSERAPRNFPPIRKATTTRN